MHIDVSFLVLSSHYMPLQDATDADSDDPDPDAYDDSNSGNDEEGEEEEQKEDDPEVAEASAAKGSGAAGSGLAKQETTSVAEKPQEPTPQAETTTKVVLPEPNTNSEAKDTLQDESQDSKDKVPDVCPATKEADTIVKQPGGVGYMDMFGLVCIDIYPDENIVGKHLQKQMFCEAVSTGFMVC